MSSEHSDIDTPPLEPIDEVTEHEHSDFSARCLAFVAPLLSKGNWEPKRELVTRSPKWGLIWRGDYAIADLAPRLVNRIMCWEGADGKLLIEIAVGQQRLAPPPDAPPRDPGNRGTQDY
ncbi:hypothetical protein [Bradyrhizobium sp. SEMIA]|uniref:hypothetical protein n=1 Tax=Bradyrhizobium sp. SEMIA TaxID=2597515 RepID=UPI0018A571CF|nr:hypothetical protein [Bradyrhizobium sp. SEMIA]QOG22038.1 hypothetical protein FOM02_36875 [Bradyrhizobium sp. SEMIA]